MPAKSTTVHGSPPATRRDLLTGMIGAAIGSGMVGLCTAEASAEASDDTAELQRLIDAGHCRIARRAAPYRLTRPLVVPGDRVIVLEAGVRLIFAGRAASTWIGVFTVMGDKVRIAAEAPGEALVESEQPSTMIYAVLAQGVAGLDVVGLRSINCLHVRVTALDPRYAAVSTALVGGHVCRDIRVHGGGTRFDKAPAGGDGACYIGYTIGWEVVESSYENVCHGIQWWGGDANVGRDGGGANERKCADFRIVGVTVRNATQCGVWGSMGRNGRIEHCAANDCGDLCFDAEGSYDVVFSRCDASDGHNGCFATFAYCRRVLFSECSGLVSVKNRPLFRSYNESQQAAETGRIAISGGRFECRDRSGPSTMDASAGPVREIAIEGAELVNVRIDTFFNNMHLTRIAGNRLTFPFLAGAFSAIRVGGSRTLPADGHPEPGSTLIENNHIVFIGSRAAGVRVVAIEAVEDDYNASPSGVIRNNVVSGPFAIAVALRNGTHNVGMKPHFAVENNVFGGMPLPPRPIELSREMPDASLPIVKWVGNRMAGGRPLAISTS